MIGYANASSIILSSWVLLWLSGILSASIWILISSIFVKNIVGNLFGIAFNLETAFLSLRSKINSRKKWLSVVVINIPKCMLPSRLSITSTCYRVCDGIFSALLTLSPTLNFYSSWAPWLYLVSSSLITLLFRPCTLLVFFAHTPSSSLAMHTPS